MATLVLRPNGYSGESFAWGRVAEAVPDEDSSHVSYGYAEAIRQVTLTDTSQTGTINSVRLDVRRRSTYVNYHPYISNRIVTHGVAYEAGYEYITSSYVTKSTTWTTNPYTGAAWTWAEVNDLTAGWRKHAHDPPTYYYTRVTWLQVVVDYSPPSVDPPSVSTLDADSISSNSARLRGSLTNTGGAECDCWLEYGETASYGASTPKESLSDAGSFAYQIAGLLPSTAYHFRAKAQNSGGLTNGADKTFTTKTREIEYYVKDDKGGAIRKAQGETYRQDTGALLETQWSDNNGKLLFTDCPNDTAIDLKVKWSNKVFWVKSILEVL